MSHPIPGLEYEEINYNFPQDKELTEDEIDEIARMEQEPDDEI